MNKLKQTLKHISARSLFFALAVLLIITGIAAFVWLQIHAMQKETLLLKGEVNTKAAAMEYNRYLLTHADIVTMVGNTLEDLLESGTDNRTIERYITSESDNIMATLDPDTTGLYGWFNGEYLDGAGWVPDDDYIPTERPWYIQTMNSGGGITLVDPYLDLQTETIMMTVSKLLADGQNIIAMDVSLSRIQEIIEQIVSTTEGGQAFLMDGDGTVIAHSDESELAKNYLAEPDSLGGIVARRLLNGETQFEVKTAKGNYTIYVDGLEGGWYSVSMINSDAWHRPIHRAMFAFSAILALVVLSVIAVFLHLIAKNAALEELHMRVDMEEKRGVELRALSETDRMTGLNDRVSGERKVNELLSAGMQGMFLELDIDHFKAINDSYGHQTGDLVILAIADALRSTFRTNDVTMRLGGDEFGVFAVGITSRELGESIVRRLFNRLYNLNIPELRGEKVCISVGAVLSREGEKLSFQELYALADDALYKSKKNRGNNLTFSET